MVSARGSKSKSRSPFFQASMPTVPVAEAGHPTNHDVERVASFADSEFEAALDALVGFESRLVHGNLCRTLDPEADRTIQTPRGGCVTDEAKRHALRECIRCVVQFRMMDGPERVAELRWNVALRSAEHTLVDFRDAVACRDNEAGYLANHESTVGQWASLRSEAARIGGMLDDLIVAVRAARDNVVGYVNDPLRRADQCGRPPLVVRARLEWILHESGFSLSQIARLIPDPGPPAPAREASAKRRAHRDRIAKRIRTHGPAFAAQRASDAAASAEWQEWIASSPPKT